MRAARSASSPRPMPSTSRIVSMYVHTTFVCGSAAAHANMSPRPSTASLPTPRISRKPGAAVRSELVHRPRHGPRLRDHADRAGDRLRRGRRAVRRHPLHVVHEPLDVRAQHRQPVTQRRLAQLRLQRPPCVARLREPGRHDHDRTHARRAALVDHPHRDARGNDDHRQVDPARQLADGGTARPAPHLVVLRVDRIQLALEPHVAERTLDLRGPAVGRLGRADDRDRARRQQRAEVPVCVTTRPGTSRLATRSRPSGPAPG